MPWLKPGESFLKYQLNLLNFVHMFMSIHQGENQERQKWMKDLFRGGKDLSSALCASALCASLFGCG
jgi:hypothetical protein